MLTGPSVTIILPVYRGEPYLESAVNSIRNSLFRDWELIIVDDGSPDQSADIATRLAAFDTRIHVVKRTNGGVCAARNTGVTSSNPGSRYLLFFDQDDTMDPNMLGSMVNQLESHPGIGMVFCRFRMIDQAGLPLKGRYYDSLSGVSRHVPHKIGFRRLRDNEPDTPFISIFAWWAGCIPSVTLLRRSVYAETSGWDETFGQFAEDWHLFNHISLLAGARFLPLTLVSRRSHDNQVSRNISNPHG